MICKVIPTIVKTCPNCGWRIFDKITPTSGIIELKCPRCKKILQIDLSLRIVGYRTRK